MREIEGLLERIEVEIRREGKKGERLAEGRRVNLSEEIRTEIGSWVRVTNTGILGGIAVRL